MSNYPAGVTGFEPQIAGAQSEYDQARHVTHDCDENKFDAPYEGDVTGTVSQWSFSERTFWFVCPQCGEEVDEEDNPEDYGPED